VQQSFSISAEEESGSKSSCGKNLGEAGKRLLSRVQLRQSAWGGVTSKSEIEVDPLLQHRISAAALEVLDRRQGLE
jgi:hypothetical protein